MDDGSHPISDTAIPLSTSGKTSEHASPEAVPEVESHSEVVSAGHDTVSTHSHMHRNIQSYKSAC